jgi:transcriptional regulator with XRE-family HTH domain
MVQRRDINFGFPYVSRYVGQRIKLRRAMVGITQRKLAELCGVTFQQLQKYESGETRITAERLYQLSAILNVPMSFMFSGLPKQTVVGDKIAEVPKTEFYLASPDENDPLAKNESLEFINMFWELPSDAMRGHVVGIMRGMLGEKPE